MPPAELRLAAPAKINLSLRILRRREDGFHELATRMVPLELCDHLTLTTITDAPAGTVRFTCGTPGVPDDESNLAVRAVRALEALTGPLPAVALHLEKHIPHGAGLGGGSSDAAAVLRGLDALFHLGLDLPTLSTAAAAIGSDVPFFLHGTACDASGRGEILTPLSPPPPPLRLLLVKPPFGVPTPWAYQRWRDSLPVPGLPCDPVSAMGETFVNDLERPVFEKFPVLGHLKARLLASPGVAAALMSGSGSTVFAVLHPDAALPPLVDAVHDIIGTEVWIRESRTLPAAIA